MITLSALLSLLAACAGATQTSRASRAADPFADNWDLALQHADVLAFSTLVTADEMRERLANDEGVRRAIEWCRRSSVTHVYLETYRSGYTVDRQTMLRAKQLFEQAGVRVSGCVTTTALGRKSVKGWFNCMTDPAARKKLEEVFRYTANLFPEIMIDDFFATDCQCDECDRARGDRTWSRFRSDLMMDVSRECVLIPARQERPNVKVILKYPQWYDHFHVRGYDVARQPLIYDRIWVGTETRNPDSKQWGRKSQYEAYFMMRWLGRIGGLKCGGGWFDSHDTSPDVYLEQARQTVLGGAREIVLFSYGSLQGEEGTADVQALQREVPQLFELARIIDGQLPRGIAAPKPPNSEPSPEHPAAEFWDVSPDEYIFDFLGLLGLPLLPDTQVRSDVPAAFLSYHALSDPQLVDKVGAMLKADIPLLVTSTLTTKLALPDAAAKKSALTLNVPSDCWSLMDMPARQLSAIRDKMLKPFGIRLDAPTRVALYLFGDDLVVLENFNDWPANVGVSVTRARLEVVLSIRPARIASQDTGETKLELPPHSLVALRKH